MIYTSCIFIRSLSYHVPSIDTMQYKGFYYHEDSESNKKIIVRFPESVHQLIEEMTHLSLSFLSLIKIFNVALCNLHYALF